MEFGVFLHSPHLGHEKSKLFEQYKFHRKWLDRARSCIGKWILYYESGHAREYFAMAKVQEVVSDTAPTGMYLALIELGSYLEFANPVPFSTRNEIPEDDASNKQRQITGEASSAVRSIDAETFHEIVEEGLGNHPEPSNPGIRDRAQTPFLSEELRERIASLTSRISRKRIFRHLVLRPYDDRCAISGLRLIDHDGHAEVDAAHIRPVKDNGPDILVNGIALSSTVHWMLDHGLISLADDLTILISRQINDIEGMHGLINDTGRAYPPRRDIDRPHPYFLRWHRENCFKQ